MDKSNSEKYNVFIKFFREAHPSMKKETQYSEGQKLWNTMKNDSEKLSHEIARLLPSRVGTFIRNLLF